MPNTARLTLGVAFLAGALACSNGDAARVRAAAARRVSETAEIASPVVQSLRSISGPDRLIYDQPPDLSMPSAAATRPDLFHPDTSRSEQITKMQHGGSR